MNTEGAVCKAGKLNRIRQRYKFFMLFTHKVAAAAKQQLSNTELPLQVKAYSTQQGVCHKGLFAKATSKVRFMCMACMVVWWLHTNTQ